MEIKKTGGGDFPLHLKMMISGPPKSGKTTLLGTVPNIIVADTEPHANNLQSIAHLNVPYVSVNRTTDLLDLLMILRDPALRKKTAADLGLPDIEAVAIDTLDTLQALMKKERLSETRQKQFLRDDWAWMKEELTKIIQAYTSLPMHVFFTVHLKSKELGGKDSDAYTTVLPGLEGSIADSIAGMVGYSVLAFRRQEIAPDGTQFTKYLLRTEGDETYDFLGNRAAGRLPEIIEPKFDTILEAAQAGHKRAEHLENQTVVQVQTTQAPSVESAQNDDGNSSIEQVKPQGAPSSAPGLANSDSDPVNSAALVHVKKVYDALALPFPEDKIRALNMGSARMLVRYWQAAQADAAEGKIPDAREEMLMLLRNSDWLADDPEPGDLDGTIEQVLAYVAQDAVKAQQAYDAELKRSKPRKSLLNTLTALGAQAAEEPTPAEISVVREPEVQVAEEPTPDAPQPTTTEPVQAAESSAQAEELVKERLGAEVIDMRQGDKTAPCEACGNPIDDPDIALLGRSRFDKWLCVKDYIAATKQAQ